MYQLVARNTRHILHPRSHPRGIAGKGPVSARAVEHKYIHIAVMKRLGRVCQGAQVLIARTASAQGCCPFNQCHRLLGCALLQTKRSHRARQRAGTPLQRQSLLHCVPHHLGVVLGDLVKLAHGGGNFLQTVALLHARGRNARHAGSHAPNAPSHLGNACAHAADDGGTGLHLLHRGVDEFANLARRFARAPRQHAHFRRHHGKATALFTGTRSFHRCVERQNIGLKSDAIDHANDFIHAPRTLLDGFHRLHCPRHLLGTLVCRLAHLAGTLVSGTGDLGMAESVSTMRSKSRAKSDSSSRPWVGRCVHKSPRVVCSMAWASA